MEPSATLSLDVVILAVIVGTLAAIVYSLRILVLLERRIARVDLNIEKITKRIVKEEEKIEKEELAIERALGIKPLRKVTKKKASKRKIRKNNCTIVSNCSYHTSFYRNILWLG